MQLGRSAWQYVLFFLCFVTIRLGYIVDTTNSWIKRNFTEVYEPPHTRFWVYVTGARPIYRGLACGCLL